MDVKVVDRRAYENEYWAIWQKGFWMLQKKGGDIACN